MIIDNQLYLSKAQAVTASADSTNTIDLGAAGDARESELWVVGQVNTTADSAADTATVTVAIQTCATIDGTYITLYTTSAIAQASLVAGAETLKVKLPLGVLRFVKGRYTVGTENLTAGKFNLFLTPAVDTAAVALA